MSFIAPKGTDFVRFIGGGSVFEVGLVRHAGEPVICKRLVPRALDTREGRAAMIREARLCAMVDHPALPRLIRVGNDWRGPFFLQTFVPGESVANLVEGWREKGRPIPPTLVRHIAVLSLSALAELAELADEAGPLGVVHGDLGPAHVILGPLGEARFVDLGAARFRGLEPELDTDDRGTLPWAAPEIARGEAKPGQTTDVYSLAATLLFLAVGEPLCFAKGDAALLAEVATQGVRRDLVGRASAFGPAEREIVFAALDPDASGRPRTAREVLDVFVAVEAHTSITSAR